MAPDDCKNRIKRRKFQKISNSVESSIKNAAYWLKERVPLRDLGVGIAASTEEEESVAEEKGISRQRRRIRSLQSFKVLYSLI